MIKKTMASFLMLLAVVFAHSQNSNHLRLTEDELPGMEEKRWSVYNEEQLWGYINGGADIYLEYGFKEVSAQDFSWQGESFKVDAYTMSSPLVAFGIFSISRYSCLDAVEISQWDCVGRQQVQIALGNLYLSVVSYSGTDRGSLLAQEIATRIVEKYEGEPFALPSFIVNSGINFNLSSVKLITGPLAMQNAYPPMEEVFASISSYELWVLPFEFDESNHTLLVATFSQSSDLQIAKDRLSSQPEDSTENWFVLNEKWLIVVRSKDSNVIKEVISKLTKELKRSNGSN